MRNRPYHLKVSQKKQTKRKYLIDDERARKRRARENREREKAEDLFHLFENGAAESTTTTTKTASSTTTALPSVKSTSPSSRMRTRKVLNPFIGGAGRVSPTQSGSTRDDDDNVGTGSYKTTVKSTQTSPGFGFKRRKKFHTVRPPPLAAFKLHRASFENYK
ncbi:unnamed protein product [Ambrosiozyma monospora]|uniref:Unnamed protein product n=1 Tax=Ambrosiozyma monospora TaxID=43982 RepID=A0A9W6WI73_AMBMO|nr:unnamed protein product [Ambrosiozyma monospora]